MALRKAILIIFSITLFIISCDNEPVPVTVITGEESDRKLIVDVLEPDTIPGYRPLQYAMVELYKSEDDLDNTTTREYHAQTDSSGRVEIVGIKHDYYYVKAIVPQYGAKVEYVTTPVSASVSYLEIIFD